MVDTVRIAKALSDPIRYQIMMMLIGGDSQCCREDNQPAGLCNCEIMMKLNLIQSRVSYHMKELVEAGLVVEEPRGKWKHYFINKRTIKSFISQLNKDLSTG